MNGINFGNQVKFQLSDDFMDTIIEDTNILSNNYGNKIILNNYAICSIAEQGKLFCEEYTKTQPDGMLPIEAPIFNLHAIFFSDYNISLRQGENIIRTHYDMFVRYYNEILCNIILKEKLDSSMDFENKNIDMIKDIKKNNPHPRDNKKEKEEDN